MALRRLLRVLLFAGLLSCTSAQKGPPLRSHSICHAVVRTPADEIVAELTSHGFEADEGFSSLGASGVEIRGSWEDAYRARDLVRRLVPERKWRVSWEADSLVVPGTDTYRKWKDSSLNKELPNWIRVASVELGGTTSSKRILGLLLTEHFPATVCFGEKEDFVLVRREQATRAVECLAKQPLLPGVTIHPHRPEEY
jgi:hypothetical protein